MMAKRQHPCKRIAKHYLFIDLVTKLGLALNVFQRNSEGSKLLADTESWSESRGKYIANSTSEASRISEEIAVAKLKELRFLAVRLNYNCGDYERAYQYCRVALFSCPNDFGLVHVFNRIIQK